MSPVPGACPIMEIIRPRPPISRPRAADFPDSELAITSPSITSMKNSGDEKLFTSARSPGRKRMKMAVATKVPRMLA